MFQRNVGHDLMHGTKDLVTRLLGQRLLRLYPHAGHLLLDGVASHVPEEGTVGVMGGCCHAHSAHVSGVHLIGGSGGAHLMAPV